jgi:hypothetical protein
MVFRGFPVVARNREISVPEISETRNIDVLRNESNATLFNEKGMELVDIEGNFF